MARARKRRILAAAAGVIAIAASVLLTAEPASAHNFLVSSTPSAGQTLTTLPSKFTITTNEGLLDLSGHAAGFAFDVEDSHGRFYGDGCVTVTGPSMSIKAAIGAAGKYRILWQIVSADGHIVSNSYLFTWKPPAGFTPAASESHPQDCNGRSGGTAPPDPNLGSDAFAKPTANLGLIFGIGGGILALGVVLIVVLVVVTRRRGAGRDEDEDDDDNDNNDENAKAPRGT